MSRRLLIDLFSPLPPLPTDIGYHTVGVARALQGMARVRIWTPQDGPVCIDVGGDAAGEAAGDAAEVEVCRFRVDALPVAVLNQADATFYNIGNNAGFHRDIHRVARRMPGIAILHDTRLQHFFAAYSETEGKDREYYLHQLERSHGPALRAMGEAFIDGTRPLQDLVEAAPMAMSAIDGTIGAVLHNSAERDALAPQTTVPLYYLPLSFRYGPCPAPAPAREAGSPSRLIMFGFIGENRRLLPILELLAAMPDREHYRLDIYGVVEQAEEADALIEAGGLRGLVTRHGFVPEAELDAALARADLALNLRWPSMGEASGSQLRIWAAGLPSLVTRVGWYAQLPAGTVFAVDPAREAEGVMEHLRALRAAPEVFAAAGRRGRAVLEREHSPERYAEALLRIASEHRAQHARRVGSALAEQAARLLLELGPRELAQPLGAELSERIAEMIGSRAGGRAGGQ